MVDDTCTDVLALYSFFNKSNTEVTNSSKISVSYIGIHVCFVCVGLSFMDYIFFKWVNANSASKVRQPDSIKYPDKNKWISRCVRTTVEQVHFLKENELDIHKRKRKRRRLKRRPVGSRQFRHNSPAIILFIDLIRLCAVDQTVPVSVRN